MIICSKCKIEKTDEHFYSDKKEKRCRECMALKYKSWLNSDSGRDKRREIHKKYTRSEKGKIRSRKAGKKYRDNPENKDLEKFRFKRNVRHKVFYALRTGKIKKCPCVVCGAIDSQAHHEDYSKPLDVVWLCSIHHAEMHKKQI